MRKQLIFFIVLFVILISIFSYYFFKQPVIKIKKYNVLYLSSDSLNKRHLSLYGYEKKTTPFLEEFAKRSIVFEKMINPSGWTNENLVSLFTGLFSPVHGVNTRGKNINPKWKTALEILRDFGYHIPRLAGWQGDQNHSFLGFEEVSVTSPEEWLENYKKENSQQPFFLFYQFLNTHLPYNCMEDTSYLAKFFSDTMFINKEQEERIRKTIMSQSVIPKGSIEFKPEDAQIIKALYDCEVALLDSCFEKVIKKLEELGLLENTIIIIGADHGEEVLEHNFVGHASTSKHASLYDEIINVTFIISFPKELPQNLRIKTQCSGVDIMPTIFDLLQIPVKPFFQGKSLLPIIFGKEGDRIVYAESSREGYGAKDPKNITEFIRMIRTTEWKLIHYVYNEDPNKFELYNLKEDELEQNNLIDKEPTIAAKLKDDLFKWLVICKEIQPQEADESLYLSPYERWKRKRELKAKKIDWSKVPSPPKFLSIKDGDTLNYYSFEGKAIFEWTGNENVPYIIEYEAGKGAYYLNGTIKVSGNKKIYGPFNKNYWNNFLVNYNPIKIRVAIDKEPYQWSEWINLNIGKSE